MPPTVPRALATWKESVPCFTVLAPPPVEVAVLVVLCAALSALLLTGAGTMPVFTGRLPMVLLMIADPFRSSEDAASALRTFKFSANRYFLFRLLMRNSMKVFRQHLVISSPVKDFADLFRYGETQEP
jgi:hypothetical protein